MNAATTGRHPIKAATDGVFNTLSGHLVDIRNPREDVIDISDIANGLSLICRFMGQIYRFYSVAQHSILVMHLAPPELQREALLHDAAEAYLGDVISPLKHLLGAAYKTLEHNFETVIAQKFGLDPQKLKAVKRYDLEALELEHKALQCDDPAELLGIMAASGMIIDNTEAYYRPIVANMEFIRHFKRLFPEQIKEDAWPGRSL